MALTDTIANTILGIGQAKAQGLQRQADITGGLLSTLGQLPGQVFGQIQQQKRQEEADQLRKLQMQEQQQQIQSQQRNMAGEDAVNRIIGTLGTRDESGAIVLDPSKLQAEFAKNNVPLPIQEKYLAANANVTKVLQSFGQEKINHRADIAHAVLTAYPSDQALDPQTASLVLDLGVANGLASEQDIAPIREALGQVQDARPLLTSVRGMSEKYKDVALKEQEFGIKQQEAETKLLSEKNAERRQAEIERHNQELEAINRSDKLTDNERQAKRDAEIQRHNKADEALGAKRIAAEDVGVALSPTGLDVAAENYAKTGQLPPMGMGKQGAAIRSRIINRAAELHPDLDLASNRAGFAADEGSLKKLQTQRDAISAFENTALKNIDTFLQTAGKVVDTGSPLANAAARAVTGKVLGSPDQAAYDAARQVALNEVAKIVSNPNLSGQLSDSARREIASFNPNSATLKQSVEVMRVLKQDMANRAKAYDDQIAEIQGRISGKKKDTAAPTGGLPSYQDYLKSRGK